MEVDQAAAPTPEVGPSPSPSPAPSAAETPVVPGPAPAAQVPAPAPGVTAPGASGESAPQGGPGRNGGGQGKGQKRGRENSYSKPQKKKKKNKREPNDRPNWAKQAENNAPKDGTNQRPPNPNRTDRKPKKKVVLLVAYLGANYAGLQRNPGQITVESVLFEAVGKAGGVAECNSDSFEKVHWQSCARTDKGVSAAGNVIGLKIIESPDLKSKINAALPQDIRVLDIRPVGKRFNPKNRCSSRYYTYLLPTYLFAPSKIHQGDKTAPFVFDPEAINAVLKYFEGSHNFHNFTSKSGPKEFNNPSANRYIMSAKCSKPILYDGQEWTKITLLGQSFVLYQIRKMVGLTICIVRDGANPRIILSCFEKPKKPLPTAPALGLFLNRCNFDDFNKFNDNQLDWKSNEQEMENFIDNVIAPSIVQKDKDHNVFNG
eukprot:TRINITY_DN3380_c0_g1_i1.p1 TRINITY_DN3380_c0_g1~~TRINITY_DN3380_c0_g1_i1.p1  ORF type:complete len:440 (-),score=95.50 TRINITY_DN3380_c0_g1_i1:243-1532(-)